MICKRKPQKGTKKEQQENITGGLQGPKILGIGQTDKQTA